MNTVSHRPGPGTGESARSRSEGLLRAALDAVGDLTERRYQREHEVDKRVLDVLRLEQSAERIGLTSLELTAEIRLFSDSAKALLFYKNMSSSLLFLDRAVTNRKPLTKAILSRAGLPVARGSEAASADEVRDAVTALAGEVVVKPVTGSGGRDVSTHLSTAEDAVAAAAPILDSGRNVLVEEMVTGIDLRVTVVDGRTVGATLRIPANVVGDGTATIAELVAAKNTVRETSDYTRHQPIELGPDKERYLAAQSLTPDSVPAQGQRVFLHYVANISAGGDSYEVLERLHPQIADLAERAAAQFPSSLHAGVDLLLERIDAPVTEQRVVICEVNLNNELPLHLYPLYGPSSPVDDLVIAAHWHKEARIPHSTWRKGEAPERVTVDLNQLTELVAKARPLAETAPAPTDAGPEKEAGGAGRRLDREQLQRALTAAAPASSSALVTDDPRFVRHRTEDGETIAERSGRTLIAGAIGADPSVMHRIARTVGIPVMARHWLRASQREKAAELVARRWRSWQLRLPQPGAPMRTVTVDSVAALDAAWEQVPTSARFRLVETPTETACVLLMSGPRLLAAQLLVPLTVTGDGTSKVGTLLAAALTARRDHPLLQPYLSELTAADVLGSADGEEVLPAGQQLQLGRSPRLVDGAAPVGLDTLPWPDLEAHAARFMTAIGNPGVATLSFVPRRRSATEAVWALWRFHSDPALAPFRFPFAGSAADPYLPVAERILTGPSRPL